jgi:demethylmenaquinone methyltransferase/2-methoxy-6-polyprenyl-1,4-benzoquinol methylase
MFESVAPRYDALNRLLSLRRDVFWRRQLASHLPEGEGLAVLDIATGTADVLAALFSETDRIGCAVGVDPVKQMLRLGRGKLAETGGPGAALLLGDGRRLAFADNSFDVVTMGFGIRNIEGPAAALKEIRRVLRPGGRVLVLEFSLPIHALVRRAYLFYFRHIVPRIGRWITGNRQAYRYLNTSVESFPCGEAFCRLLAEAGFQNLQAHRLTLGIATIYLGDKAPS